MPASDRPRRSTRTRMRIDSTSDHEEEEKEFTHDIVDTDEESFQGDKKRGNSTIKSSPNNKKLKTIRRKETNPKDEENVDQEDDGNPPADKPIIPKRKKDPLKNTSESRLLQEEVKLKKKQDAADSTDTSNRTSEKAPTSSLIANMAPVDVKKLQPSIRDWKSKEDYQQFVARNRESRSFGSKAVGGGNMNKMSYAKPGTSQPYHAQHMSHSGSDSMQQEMEPQQEHQKKMFMNGPNQYYPKRFEICKKIFKDFNELIFKVMESEGRKRSVGLDETGVAVIDLLNEIAEDNKSKDKVPKNPNSIDWYGSFIPMDHEEKYDFGNMDEYPPIPMFPDDFSSKKKQWPLSWWGIIPPSDDLLDCHDGFARPKRRSNSRDRSRNSRDRSYSHSREESSRREKRRRRSRERSSRHESDKGRRSRESRHKEIRNEEGIREGEPLRKERSSRERDGRDFDLERQLKYRDHSQERIFSKDGQGREGVGDRNAGFPCDDRDFLPGAAGGYRGPSRDRHARDRGMQGKERDYFGEDKEFQGGERNYSGGPPGGYFQGYGRDREFSGEMWDRDREPFGYRQNRGWESYGGEKDFAREKQLGDRGRSRDRDESTGKERQYSKDRQQGKEYFRERPGDNREFQGRPGGNRGPSRDREFVGDMPGRERDFLRDQAWRGDEPRGGPPFQGGGWRDVDNRGPPPFRDNYYAPSDSRGHPDDARFYGDRGGGPGYGPRGVPGPGRPYGAYGPGPGPPARYQRR